MGDDDQIIEEIDELKPEDIDDGIDAGTDDGDPSGDELEDPEPDLELDDPPKKKGGVQVKIDKLTRRAREAEEGEAFYKGLALGAGLIDSHGNVVNKEKPPSRGDFDTEDEYLDAAVEHRTKEKSPTKPTAFTVDARFVQGKYDEGREKYKDFDEVALQPNTHPVTEEMLGAAIGGNLHDILYYLGKNRGESNRIAKLPPAQQIKEITKIEVKLTAPKKKKVTKAPSPAPNVKGEGANPPPTKETRKERWAEWEKKRVERIKSGQPA